MRWLEMKTYAGLLVLLGKSLCKTSGYKSHLSIVSLSCQTHIHTHAGKHARARTHTCIHTPHTQRHTRLKHFITCTSVRLVSHVTTVFSHLIM